MNNEFYHQLPSQKGSLKTILRKPESFVTMPADWRVIVSDIQGSTKATIEGRGRDINTLAASCVIACINIAKQHQIEIPFLYGGDGATMIVPEIIADEMVAALKALRANAHQSYQLRLRVGSLPVGEIYKAKEDLRIAKWAVAPGYNQAIFLGNGLLFADKVIKSDPATSDIPENEMPKAVNLEGLMCRWNEIEPMKPKEEVVCSIIEAKDVMNQASVYAEVLDAFDRIYGEYKTRHPVSEESMRPAVKIKNIARRDRLSTGSTHPFVFLNETIRTVFHAMVFRLKLRFGGFDSREYLQELVKATDTLHVSGGTMYTIISGTTAQRDELRKALDQMEDEGKIVYGVASCPSSVMTCYVDRVHEGHHHFLDGAGGGYTLAAKEWKEKRK